MALLQNSIIPVTADAADDYVVENSLKFDGSSSFLGQDPIMSSGATWTISLWVKRSGLGSTNPMLQSYIKFNADDTLTVVGMTTTAVFRDTSSWYHIFAAPTVGLFVNGVQHSGTINESTGMSWGTTWGWGLYSGDYFDGYMAEIHFIDGTAKAHTDFAETDSNGQWVPKEYTGSYGTNGFHLNFSDSADLGADAAGSNDFTATNLGSHDQMADSPNNNFCTLNPVTPQSGPLSEGNLKLTNSASSALARSGTFGMDSGLWYFEARLNAPATSSEWVYIGVTSVISTDHLYLSSNSYILYTDNSPHKYQTVHDGTETSWGSGTVTAAGDIIGVAFDADAGEVWYSVNGVWNDGSTTFPSSSPDQDGLSTTKTWFPSVAAWTSSTIVNFGADATFVGTRATAFVTGGGGEFAYAPPSGYKALCTANLPAPGVNNAISSEKSFAVATWDGTYDFDNSAGTEEQNIDIGFHPGIVWVKDRENWASYSSTYYDSYGHWLFDIIQGSGYALDPSADQDESASRSDNTLISGEDGISSFAYTSGAAKGFTVDAPETNIKVDDYSGGFEYGSYVGWAWKLGSGATASEKYNAAAGISVVKWAGTGDGDDDISISHSLGAAPDMVWVSDLSGYDGNGLVAVWHKDLAANKYLLMSESNAQDTDDGYYFQNPPNGATTLDVTGYLNYDPYDYQAYLFRSVEGYSKIGSYEGNGDADGPFVYCGFRPRYVLLKNADSAANWVIHDTAREPYNVMNDVLFADDSGAEYGPLNGDSGAVNQIDALSNGFKLRNSGTQAAVNGDGDTMLYACFAENPFKYANAR